MKNSFVRKRFVARRNLAFRDKARELSRESAKSSDGSQMIFEYNRGAPSYPDDVLPDGNQTRIKTAYTPYGLVTSTGSVTQSPRGLGGGLDKPEGFAPQGRAADGASVSQPIQWSSEYADTDLALVYYNYRHYNPLDGRWCGRDPKGTENGANLYIYTGSNPLGRLDVKGLSFEDLACYLYMTNPESEYKTCIEQCENDLYYDFKSIERFVNSANQANSSIGTPHGSSPQEIIAVALYVIAYVKYKSCLSDCTYAYKHRSKCKTLECPIIL